MAEVIEGQRTFTVEEYHRMGEAGEFGPDERVELIWGVIRERLDRHRAIRFRVECFVDLTGATRTETTIR